MHTEKLAYLHSADCLHLCQFSLRFLLFFSFVLQGSVSLSHQCPIGEADGWVKHKHWTDLFYYIYFLISIWNFVAFKNLISKQDVHVMFRVVLLADIVVIMQRALSKSQLQKQQQQQQRGRHLWIKMQNYQKKMIFNRNDSFQVSWLAD